jgi:hypothetical protein
MITKAKLEELKRLTNNATPGPWIRVSGNVGVNTNAPYELLNTNRLIFKANGEWLGEFLGVCTGHLPNVNWQEEWNDMAFIAASREAIPELIAEIEKSHKIVDVKNQLAKIVSDLIVLDYINSVKIEKEISSKSDMNPIYKIIIGIDDDKKKFQLSFTKMELEDGGAFTDYITLRFIDAIKFELDETKK